ncbi:MAG: murein biosynthesis integral membrane protein MurJ [Acidobacteria bacterium]|nr:murein biosynthesis integral membrane protein MurJ [Acidobacteriota bacterium]
MKKLTTKVLKGGAVLTSGTLLSRVLGFVREILAAAFFGGGRLYDAFVIAFSVPALFRRILGEEMFERAFMPPFERLRSQGQASTARRLVIRIFFVLGLVLLVLTAVLFFFMPTLVHFLAPGLSPDTAREAVLLGKQVLPFLTLISFSTLTGAVLLFSDRKVVYSTAPAVMNVVIILALIAFHRHLGITALIIAYLSGAAAFFLFQLPVFFRVMKNLKEDKTANGEDPLNHSLKESSRIFVTALANKGVEIVDRMVASLVGSGAISSLWYSFRIIHLPFAIMGLAISRSIAPELSRLRGSRNYRDFGNVIHLGVDTNLFLLVPVTIFFMIFSREVITLFYFRGAFTLTAVDRTSLAFFYYALAILPMGLIALLNRIFSAFENNRAPMRVAVFGACLNVFLDFILYQTPLKQGGIALATAISQAVQVLFLFAALGRYPIRIRLSRILATVGQLLFALLFFVPILILGKFWMPETLHFFTLFFWLGGIGAIAFIFYGIVAYGFLRSRRTEKMKVVLTGGGTGGHVYPSLSIYQILLDKNRIYQVRYWGIHGRAEEEIVPRTNIPLEFVPAAPIAGGSPAAKLRSAVTIFRGTMIAMGKLLRFRPHLVVAAGGYVSAPVVFGAYLLKPFLKLKIVIDEQNLVPGLLNKTASLMADAVLVNFRESAYFMWSNRCVYTGYPVRPDYLKPGKPKSDLRKELDIPENAFLVVVSGGSMGARAINCCMADAMDRLSEMDNLFIVHSIGMSQTSDYHALDDTVKRLAASMDELFDKTRIEAHRKDGTIFYRGSTYFHDIYRYQQAADLLICRAGAGALAEAMALAKPTLLIPKRGLPGDHQELNAISIAEQGAMDVLFEEADTKSNVDRIPIPLFLERIDQLMKNEEYRKTLGESAARLFFRHSADRIYATIDSVIKQKEIEGETQIVEPRFVQFQRTFDNLIRFLDHNASKKNNLYVRFYNIKVHEYLASNQPLTVNKGIKLIGSLKRVDLYPFIYENFDDFHGFQKRNALAALTKADQFQVPFKNLVEKGLRDSYFETRREAVSLFNCFHTHLADDEIHKMILNLLKKRIESFEVKAEAIGAAVRILDQNAFLKQMEPVLFARNIRYREALLDAIRDGLNLNRFENREIVRNFLKRMLITTSQFQPSFTVRQRFLTTIKKLEETDHD